LKRKVIARLKALKLKWLIHRILAIFLLTFGSILYYLLAKVRVNFMKHRKKEDVITFKVDQALSEALHGIENRSAFIRQAVLTALEATCPLCLGTGILTKSQLDHWKDFDKTHAVEECPDCHAVHLICGFTDSTEENK